VFEGKVSTLKDSLTAGYRWRRLWVPREGFLDLSDQGFPHLPDDERRQLGGWKHDAVYFDAIANTPCLILLGEPGMGKTHALQEERLAVESMSGPNESKTLFLDLRSYSSEDRLIRDLFESLNFIGWNRGEYALRVMLDSLDECLLRIDTVATLLGDKFQELPSVLGLSLRVACRTAEWSPGLERALRSKWGDSAFGVFEIVPLTRHDVIEAADANALDSRRFLEEVEKREVVPLAFKPVTLEFLLKSFRENRQLPTSQHELYARGCRLLCAETNESRAYSALRGRLTAEQRLEVAARMAAATIFCNRNAIWRVDTPPPEADITIDELCGERAPNGISRDDVLETLGTGLFSSRGTDRMGWVHHTYAEFLAARFVSQQGMPAEQIFNLLMHRGAGEPRLVPQLHETAAWLATMNGDVFAVIIKTDPEVLLRSDIATAAPEDRAAVVDAIIRAWNEGALTGENEQYVRYHKLAHPDLAGQLRQWILERALSAIARKAAIEIAQACELKEIGSDLASVALDSTEHYRIRTAAARCIAETADEAIKARLKPLAIAQASDDPFDCLKGFALLACWPKHLSSEELFTALTPASDKAFGAYHMFLTDELPKQLDAADLLVALRWMEQRLRGGPFEKLEAAIFRRAISHLHQPEVRELFARVALEMLRHHLLPGHKGEREAILSDNQRHSVVECLLPLMSEHDVIDLLFGSVPLVTEDEVTWLISQASRLESEQSQTVLAHILVRLFDRGSLPQIEALLDLKTTRPAFARIFAPFFDPVELDSAEARSQRESYQRAKSRELREQTRREEAVLKPPPAERIASLLQDVQDGNIDAWWRITMDLTLSPTSRHYHHLENVDLTDTPGWHVADSVTRDQLLAAAVSYIRQRDASPDRWFSAKDIYDRPAMAGFKALLLLAKEAPGEFAQISSETWKRWVPIIVAAPEFSEHEKYAELTEAAYNAAPTETLEWLLRTIDKENQESGRLSVLGRFEGISDERLGAALVSKITSTDLKTDALITLLRFLLERKVIVADQFARTQIAMPVPKEESARNKALSAAKLLLKHEANGAWDVIWPAMLQDPAFGRTLWTQIAYDAFVHPSDAVSNLSESQVAELYIWLMGEFPPEEDGSTDMDHGSPDMNEVSWREAIAHFRDLLIPDLRERGTPEAYTAIERLMHQFPSFDWLKRVLAQAQERVRRKSWQPPKPAELFALAANHKRRLVRNGDELLALVIDALHRIEVRLRSEGLVQFLWDKTGRDTFQPKDEKALSDFVKSFLDNELRQRGIVVNREVETRRGEETDIYVDALVRGQAEQFDKVSIVIETKGCWHRELRDAIETQLVNRYLKESACRHGLYLVGWFSSPKWNDADHRKRAVKRLSLPELQEALTTKARTLCTGGVQVQAHILNVALH
jgi:predicted NACHT family NTPase